MDEGPTRSGSSTDYVPDEQDVDVEGPRTVPDRPHPSGPSDFEPSGELEQLPRRRVSWPELDDDVQVRVLAGRTPDRLGLVDGRNPDHVRQTEPQPTGAEPSGRPCSSRGPTKALTRFGIA